VVISCASDSIRTNTASNFSSNFPEFSPIAVMI
jgi:hypothetical protein